MAHIQKIKLKTGVGHQVTYYIDGHKRTKYFPPRYSLKQVKLLAAQLEATKNRDFVLKPLKLGELKTEFVHQRRNDTDTQRHEQALDLLIKFLDPDLPIHKIGHHTIHEFREHLFQIRERTDVEQKKRGINKELAYLRAVFNWAYRKEFMPANIFDKVDFYKAAQPTLRIPDEVVEHKFYRALPKWSNYRSPHTYSGYRLAFLIIKYAGLRTGEVMKQDWESSFDFENGVIFLGKAKSGRVESMPLHPTLSRIIQKLKHKRPDLQGPMFPFGKFYLTTGYRRAFKRIGFDDIKSPVHIWRHMFVTKIRRQTKKLYIAQKAARHSSPNVTRRYDHVEVLELGEDLAKIKF
jgi:integrase